MRPLSSKMLKALKDPPLAAWFLGPKAEQSDVWQELLLRVFNDYIHWRRNYFPQDPIVISRERQHSHEQWWDALTTLLDQTLDALKAHYPFHSPRYIAHMLSEQSLPGLVGYFAGMLYNPNNVTDEAAPVTVRLELEFGRMVAQMLGFKPAKAWAHICSGGTVANIEALWVARAVTFTPLILREHCMRHSVQFQIRAPNGEALVITDASNDLLLSLRPNEAIFMTRKLARFEIERMGMDREVVLKRLNESLRKSAYNPRYRGYASVERKVGRRPVIFVSAAAHYCIKKAANLMGYGEDSVRIVPVASNFRIDADALSTTLRRLRKDEYVAAVIGIVGTTEEGAIDPVHQIAQIRDDLGKEKNRSFWLHIDAAWGGYFRAAFAGHDFGDQRPTDIGELYSRYRDAIGARESVPGRSGGQAAGLSWDNPEVYKALIAISEADSVTVDPHKMGYVPYPAGVIVFKNGLVTEHLTQRAQYISAATEGVSGIDDPPVIDAVGPYVLEGSKPGFVAVGCWLAATAIPLTIDGHGKVIKTVALNAKKLHRYLSQHTKAFIQIERRLGLVAAKGQYDTETCPNPFTFVPLNDPDTNVVCFVAMPMKWKGGALDHVDVSLLRLNTLNRNLHGLLDIPDAQRGTTMPYSKEFFVSQTSFDKQQYSYESLRPVLDGILRIPATSYNRHGLTVLRATVMNPFYFAAVGEGIDYLWEYVGFLHRCARLCLGNMAPSAEAT